ncbi:MAG: rhamnogalacturonan acetylesterase [Verrucomicrobiales bacterium]|nr:rhamnogalacturonan acetylesterase [Verrucomicrobiales bacterium]
MKSPPNQPPRLTFLTILLTASMLPLAAAEPGKTLTIGLIGDSTVASTYGWGPAFAGNVSEETVVRNVAKNGATSASLSETLDELLKEKPDYVLIQFGHNDQKRYGTEVYRANLRSYVERIREAGGKAVILSSVTRRNFNKDGSIQPRTELEPGTPLHGDLKAFGEAAEAVAKEMTVPFIDLYSISVAHHQKLGPEASAAYNFKEGDVTHFSEEGAEAIASLVIAELKTAVPSLAPSLTK